jgi:hypothetical protein
MYALLTAREVDLGECESEELLDVPPPRALLRSIPKAVDAVVKRSLLAPPSERYPSAAAMIAELQAVLAPPTRRRPASTRRPCLAQHQRRCARGGPRCARHQGRPGRGPGRGAALLTRRSVAREPPGNTIDAAACRARTRAINTGHRPRDDDAGSDAADRRYDSDADEHDADRTPRNQHHRASPPRRRRWFRRRRSTVRPRLRRRRARRRRARRHPKVRRPNGRSPA